MAKASGWVLAGLIFTFLFLTLLDLGLNLLSFIPAIGPVFESAGELVIEGAQAILFIATIAYTGKSQ